MSQAQVSKLAMIGEIASGIANELGQPLMAIGNYAQACKRLLSRPQIEPETLFAAVEGSKRRHTGRPRPSSACGECAPTWCG